MSLQPKEIVSPADNGEVNEEEHVGVNEDDDTALLAKMFGTKKKKKKRKLDFAALQKGSLALHSYNLFYKAWLYLCLR
jgi:hypothetical protein